MLNSCAVEQGFGKIYLYLFLPTPDLEKDLPPGLPHPPKER